MNSNKAATDMSKPPVTLLIDVKSIEQVLDPSITPLSGHRLHPDVASHLAKEAFARHKAGRFEVVFRVENHTQGKDGDLAEAVGKFANEFSIQATRDIKEIMKDGWISFWIGMLAVAAMFSIAEALPELGERSSIRAIIEGVVIFYWVILWRPAELILYDHIELRRHRKAAQCLSRAVVRSEQLRP